MTLNNPNPVESTLSVCRSNTTVEYIQTSESAVVLSVCLCLTAESDEDDGSNDSNGSIFDSNPTNYVAKQQLYKSYVFPTSTSDRAIIKQCSSGVGYERRFDPQWSSIIEKARFDKVMDQVS